MQKQPQSMLDLVRSYLDEGKWDEITALLKKTNWGSLVGDECSQIMRFLDGSFRPLACPDCGKTTEGSFSHFTFGWSFEVCPSCQYEKDIKEIHANIDEILLDRGIPRRFLGADMKNMPKSYKTVYKDLNEGRGLYIYGPRGVGKTYFASALAKVPIWTPPRTRVGVDRRIFPLFVSVPEFLMEIKNTFRKGSQRKEEDVLSMYSDAYILILDDLGVEKPSDWVAETLYVLINRRYEDMRRTIITSNIALPELSMRLDDRIASRIAEMCKVVIMKGEDRRVQKA